MDKDTTSSASDALQKARELAKLHEEFDFKDSSKSLGQYSDSICLRDGDFRIDFSHNNMSVYTDCKFVQGDIECSCWDDVANCLRQSSEFVEGCYKNLPAIHAELEEVTAERDGAVNLYNIMVKKYQDVQAERDKLLKSYKEMWSELCRINAGITGDDIEGELHQTKNIVQDLLNSFPEIK